MLGIRSNAASSETTRNATRIGRNFYRLDGTDQRNVRLTAGSRNFVCKRFSTVWKPKFSKRRKTLAELPNKYTRDLPRKRRHVIVMVARNTSFPSPCFVPVPFCVKYVFNVRSGPGPGCGLGSGPGPSPGPGPGPSPGPGPGKVTSQGRSPSNARRTEDARRFLLLLLARSPRARLIHEPRIHGLKTWPRC